MELLFVTKIGDQQCWYFITLNISNSALYTPLFSITLINAYVCKLFQRTEWLHRIRMINLRSTITKTRVRKILRNLRFNASYCYIFLPLYFKFKVIR